MTDEITPQRQSVLSKTNRRSTFYLPNILEQPVGNPDNSPEANELLKKEYEKLQLVNRAIELSLSDFQKTIDTQKSLAEHVNDTDCLLNIWSSILEKTEDYREVLEDPEWEKLQKQ